jgi:hypothetical protein
MDNTTTYVSFYLLNRKLKSFLATASRPNGMWRRAKPNDIDKYSCVYNGGRQVVVIQHYALLFAQMERRVHFHSSVFLVPITNFHPRSGECIVLWSIEQLNACECILCASNVSEIRRLSLSHSRRAGWCVTNI